MLDSLIRDTAKVLTKKTKETKPYDTTAEVVRIEGNTAWVHISGGVIETPVDMTINAKAGDQVNVRVSGGKAWITGNGSAPPTDDATAVKAQTTATEAKTVADSAQADASRASVAADSAEASARSAQQSATAASEAAAIADGKAVQAKNAADAAKAQAQNASEYASRALGNLSTVQSVAETLTWITQHGTMTLTSDTALDPTHVYFVVDPNGDYTVGSTKYSIVTEPDVADISTYYELSIDESLNNYVGTHLALTNEGLWLLPASSGTNKVLIATGAGSTYTTAGTYIIDSNGGTVASFRANGATIGEVLSGRTRTEIGTSGMQIIQRAGGNDTTIANLGYGLGTDSGDGTSNAPFYTFGTRATTSTAYDSSATYSVGDLCVYDAKMYVCTTNITTPEAWNSNHWRYYIGNYSVAEGTSVISANYNSHSEGSDAKSIGISSHSEGYSTLASGVRSHAEGNNTSATGPESHAEGFYTKSNGKHSHSEGNNTVASGERSHAQNYYTVAASVNQTALGKYNVADSSNTYSVIIGNGTADNARSNALTVDWSGNVNIASGAKYKINGTNLGAGDVSAVALADKYKRSSAGSLDWTNQTDGDAKVIAKSALAFWNGAYSGNSSNLSKCSTGSIVGTNGATMTGQLQTSFQPYNSPDKPISVAMGSYGSNQTTVDGLAGEIRYSSGAAGSASINTAYTKSGVTIPTGWYNFFYMPHRSGGKNGAADGDNHQYGNLFLFGMNNTNGQFIVRVSSGSVAEVVKLVTTASVISESKLLKDNVTINANSYGNGSLNVSKTNYTPIGIVGMHLENASSSGANNTYCACHSFYLSGSTAYWIVKNNHTSSAKIKVTATILYVAS